jgi:sugar-specific transcriptional regulator TrmB
VRIDDKLVKGLATIGLTEYQAKVYIATVGLGEASAYAIAEAADVPRSKVYSVLDDLVDEIGFIEKIPADRGSTYRALPPVDTIDNALAKIVKTIQQVKKGIDTYQEKIESKVTEPTISLFTNANALLTLIADNDFFEAWLDR